MSGDNFHACGNNNIVLFVPYYFSRNTVLKLRVIVMNFLFTFTSFRTLFSKPHFMIVMRVYT